MPTLKAVDDLPSSSSTSQKCSQNDWNNFKTWCALQSLKPVTPLFKCCLCSGNLKDTHIVSTCLHRFCADCIRQSIETHGTKCPSCGAVIETANNELMVKRDEDFDAIAQAVLGVLGCTADLQKGHQHSNLAQPEASNSEELVETCNDSSIHHNSSASGSSSIQNDTLAMETAVVEQTVNTNNDSKDISFPSNIGTAILQNEHDIQDEKAQQSSTETQQKRKQAACLPFSEWLEMLRRYKQNHGHCRVEKHHDPRLYKFCAHARTAYQITQKQTSGDPIISKGKIRALEMMGLEWNEPSKMHVTPVVDC